MMAAEKREPSQKRIEQAAVELFAEYGYHGSTMRQIARIAGVRPASVYHWYDSKEAILESIMQMFLEGLTREVVGAVDRYSAPVDRLSAFVWSHVVYHGMNRGAAFVTDTEIRALKGKSRAAIMRLRNGYEQLLSQMLRDGQSDATFAIEDVEVVVKVILLECTGVTAWFRPNGRLTLPHIADLHVDLVLASLGTQRSAVFARGQGQAILTQ
jgi:AcrR family transcriptional regulator